MIRECNLWWHRHSCLCKLNGTGRNACATKATRWLVSSPCGAGRNCPYLVRTHLVHSRGSMIRMHGNRRLLRGPPPPLTAQTDARPGPRGRQRRPFARRHRLRIPRLPQQHPHLRSQALRTRTSHDRESAAVVFAAGRRRRRECRVSPTRKDGRRRPLLRGDLPPGTRSDRGGRAGPRRRLPGEQAARSTGRGVTEDRPLAQCGPGEGRRFRQSRSPRRPRREERVRRSAGASARNSRPPSSRTSRSAIAIPTPPCGKACGLLAPPRCRCW